MSLRTAGVSGYKAILRPFLQRTGLESGALTALLLLKVRYGALKRHEVDLDGFSASFYAKSNTSPIENRLADEEPVIMDMRKRLRKDDIFYDIGAQYGLYTCLMGNWTERTVVAFEPLPMTFARLRLNVRHNEVDAIPLRTGLTSKRASQPSRWLQKEGRVPLSRGDDIISREGLPSPTVLKIDVEGGELEVVKGLKQTLSSDECRLVYCEVHREGSFEDANLGNAGLTVSEIEELETRLSDAGFDVERMYERGDQFFLRGRK